MVQITATSVTQHDRSVQLPAADADRSSRSAPGFVIDKAGHIVTNYHVIAGRAEGAGLVLGQDQITATVVGKDPSTDTAVLKIDAHARALTPLPLGDSDARHRSATRCTRSATRSGSPAR